jgi:hypothetical protein
MEDAVSQRADLTLNLETPYRPSLRSRRCVTGERQNHNVVVREFLQSNDCTGGHQGLFPRFRRAPRQRSGRRCSLCASSDVQVIERPAFIARRRANGSFPSMSTRIDGVIERRPSARSGNYPPSDRNREISSDQSNVRDEAAPSMISSRRTCR